MSGWLKMQHRRNDQTSVTIPENTAPEFKGLLQGWKMKDQVKCDFYSIKQIRNEQIQK